MAKIDLFCGINSIGMPFPRENKNHIGYFDIVKHHLEESGYEVDGINISSLNRNQTWNLEEMLNKNYSLSKIKNIQVASIDSLRNNNALFKLVIPKKVKHLYEPNEQDYDTTFRDIYVSSERPIFLLSVGLNDFFTFIQAGPVELIYEKVRENLPDNLEELIIKCVDNVEKNLVLLHELNPNVKISAIGWYYSPLFDKIQKLIYLQEKMKDKNKKYKNNFNNIIEMFNSYLEKRCEKYDFV